MIGSSLSLFDYEKSQKLKELGMDKVSGYPADSWIATARNVAVALARKNKSVSVNDVLIFLQDSGLPKPDDVHPNAIGCIMKDKRLKLIGYKKSDKVSAHARTIGVYTLREE